MKRRIAHTLPALADPMALGLYLRMRAQCVITSEYNNWVTSHTACGVRSLPETPIILETVTPTMDVSRRLTFPDDYSTVLTIARMFTSGELPPFKPFNWIPIGDEYLVCIETPDPRSYFQTVGVAITPRNEGLQRVKVGDQFIRPKSR